MYLEKKIIHLNRCVLLAIKCPQVYLKMSVGMYLSKNSNFVIWNHNLPFHCSKRTFYFKIFKITWQPIY